MGILRQLADFIEGLWESTADVPVENQLLMECVNLRTGQVLQQCIPDDYWIAVPVEHLKASRKSISTHDHRSEVGKWFCGVRKFHGVVISGF